MCVSGRMDDRVQRRAGLLKTSSKNLACRVNTAIEIVTVQRITGIERIESLVKRAGKMIFCWMVGIQVIRCFECQPGERDKFARGLVNLYDFTLAQVEFAKRFFCSKIAQACPAVESK